MWWESYQALIKLRKELPIWTEGNYTDLLPSHESVWVYRRQANGQTLTVLANLSNQAQKIELSVKGEVLMNNNDELKMRENTVVLKLY